MNTTVNGEHNEIHNIKIPVWQWANFSGRLGLDYSLDTNTTLGLMVSPYMGGMIDNETVNSNIVAGDYDYDKTLGKNDIRDVWEGNVYNVNLERKIKKGNWNFDVDYITNYSESKQVIDNTYHLSDAFVQEEVYNTNIIVDLDAITGKVDFQKSLKKSLDFESGVKFSDLTQVNNTASRFQDDTTSWSAKLDFKYNEKIYAAYASLSKKWGDQVSGNLGVRYEYSKLSGATGIDSISFDSEFSNFFPNASIRYNTNKNWNHSLSLTIRVKRPEYWELIPFEQRVNPFLISQGNPNLLPQILNQFNYGLSFFESFNFNAIYGVTAKGLFLTANSKEGEVIQRFQFKNLGEEHNLSFTLNGPVKPLKNWLILWNLTAYRNQLVNSPGFNFGFNTFHFRLQNQFTLWYNWKAEFVAFYQHNHYWNVWYQDGFLRFDCSLSRKYNDWKFNIIGTDIFGLREHPGGFNQGAVTSINYFVPEKQVFRVSAAYNFGNKRLKKQRDRGTSSEDLKERT